MTIRQLAKFGYFAGALALGAYALPSAAHAAETWWKATSSHFIVYSQGKMDDARELAVNLERLDEAERFMRNIKPDERALTRSEKLTIYQFGETSDIGRLAGRRGVAGFFIPRAGHSVAFVPLRVDRSRGIRTETSSSDLGPESVLFHEYTHYFMFQHAAAAYPIWYTEGFAELFATLALDPDGFRLGEVPEYRRQSLHYESIDIDKLLDPPADLKGLSVADIYSGGWLMTSYLSMEESRAGQLDAYLRRINAGENKLEAAKAVFGDLGQLKSDLDKYRRGRSRVIGIKFDNYTPPTAEVGPVADDIAQSMMLRIRSERGVTEEDAPGLVPEGRSLAAAYPSSESVLVLAASVELDAKNLPQAESFANRALAIKDEYAPAQLILAQTAMKRAENDPAQILEARTHYVAANRVDNLNAQALYGYYLTFALRGEQPPEDALIALEESFRLAAFDQEIRQTLVWQLLNENRDREAKIVFGPLINDQHASKKRRERWQKAAEFLDSGNKAAAMPLLVPTIVKRDEDDDDD